jgi:hypothetical protein
MWQRVERFQSGRTSIVDEDHLGHPTTSRMADDVEGVNALVQGGREITVNHTANKLVISCGPEYSIIYENLRYQNSARWVPKQLTDEHKQKNMCAIFFSNIMKERFSCNRLSQVMRHGCTTITCKQTSKHGVETHVITKGQEIQKCALCCKGKLFWDLCLSSSITRIMDRWSKLRCA